MLDRLLRLKPFIQHLAMNIKELYIDVDVWNNISALKSCLEPCKKATTALQKADIHFADFHETWNKCLLSLQKLGHYYFVFLIFITVLSDNDFLITFVFSYV